MADDNVHKGHRKLIKDRYIKSGLSSFPDHLILEFLLFFGIPQKDTNELAHRLIDEFGSLAAVLQADFNQLSNVAGMTENAACLLSVIVPTYARYAESLNQKKFKLNSIDEVVSLLKPRFLGKTNESVFAVCFDLNQKFISVNEISDGDDENVNFNLRSLASIVLKNNAKFVILAHNHVTEIALPSNEDVKVTKKVKHFLDLLNVHLIDHLIMTSNDFYSMAQSKKFSAIFNRIE